MKKVVFIAGPFRADTPWKIEQNVRKAETAALEVWKTGAAALCPHANTRFFQDEAPDVVWLEGGLEMLRRCDAVLMVGDWRSSRGALAERETAFQYGLKVFDKISECVRWLRGGGDGTGGSTGGGS